MILMDPVPPWIEVFIVVGLLGLAPQANLRKRDRTF